MSKQTQQQWFRHMALDSLDELESPLHKLERLAKNAGRAMPARIRKKIERTIAQNREREQMVRSWAITETEKAVSEAVKLTKPKKADRAQITKPQDRRDDPKGQRKSQKTGPKRKSGSRSGTKS